MKEKIQDVKNENHLLTDEQLDVLAKNGDEDAVNELFTRYKNYVVAISRSFFLNGGDMEDIIQEGMIGLYNAIKSYKGDHNSTFKTYAIVCIKHKIQTAIKHANTGKNKVLSAALPILEQAEYDDDYNGEILLISDLPTPVESVIAKENANELNKQIKEKLSTLEQKILKLYLTGYNYREIAEISGVNSKSIDNALTRIKRKLMFLKKQQKDVV